MHIHVAEWPRRARVLLRSAVVAATAVYLGLYVQGFAFAQTEPLPDFVVSTVDAQSASTDVNTLALSGTLSAEIANTGTASSGGTVDLLVFHDADHNNRFDSGTDPILGQSTVTAPDAGASAVLVITVSGQLPFRDAPIGVWVDSSQSIVESDEGNNVGTSASACVVDLPPDPDGTGITVVSGFTVQNFASAVTDRQGPISLTFDSKGNLYMAPGDEGRIVKFPAGSNVPQLFGEVGISDPDGVAIDSQDNIIVSGDPVTKFTPNGEVIWQVSCPVDNIQLVTVDRDDNVYVGSLGTQICKIAPDGSSFVTLGSFNQPSELAVSPDGFLYISQLGARNIVKATLDTAEILEVINSPISAVQPAFDPVGDLFVGQRTRVYKIDLPEKTISPFASGFAMARSLAFDTEGDLFVGDSTSKNIYKFPATRQLDLTASLLRAVADSTGGVGLRVRIGNAGRSQSRGSLLVSFYEGDPIAGGVLLGSVTTGPIDAGGFRDISLDGITGLSGTVDLFAVVDADNQVPECNETNNTVQIPGDVIARLGQIVVSTDQVIYGALTPVFLQAQVTNAGSLAGVVSAALQVEDASGNLIQAFDAQDVGPLGPGESAGVNAEWNTATFAAGPYRARGVLYASDGTILSEATSGFEIRHSDTPGEVVVAALRTMTNRTLYHTTDVVELHNRVGNLSTDTVLVGTYLRLSIVDPNGQTIFGPEDIRLDALAPGQITDDIAIPVSLRVGTEGTFRVLGSVIDTITETVLASDETQFNVQVDLRQALNGSVTAKSATLDVGVPQECTFTIQNNELISITGLEVHHSMLNLDTQQLVADFSGPMELGAEAEVTSLPPLTFVTANLAAGEYACVLRAKVGETLEILASAPFTLTVPPIRIAAGIQVGARGRLLVLIDALDKNGNGGDPHGPNGASGLTSQRALLESLISAAGWSHTIVDSADDFARELRSGGYTVYALFAEDEMLSDRVQEELREAVFRGEGLVVAGLHDTRQQELGGPLGVRIAGNAKQASSVAVRSDVLGVNGSIALLARDNALRAEPIAAASAGTYEGGDVAVTTHTYGAGRSVFAGFDLLATATRDGDASFAVELLAAALTYVHPSAITQTAGDVVPVEIVLQNEGIATSVTVSLPVPSGTVIIDPSTATFDDVTRTLNWSFALAQSEERTLEFWLQLPGEPGTLTLQASVAANGMALAEPSATLDVLAPQDLASIFVSIDALLAGDIDAKLRQALEKARHKLQDAEARLPDDPENAVKEALKAAEALAAVDDDQATLVRVTVGLWIKWIAQQL